MTHINDVTARKQLILMTPAHRRMAHVINITSSGLCKLRNSKMHHVSDVIKQMAYVYGARCRSQDAQVGCSNIVEVGNLLSQTFEAILHVGAPEW